VTQEPPSSQPPESSPALPPEPPPEAWAEPSFSSIAWTDVKAELDKLQTKRRGMIGNLLTLAVTLFLFVAMGVFSLSGEGLAVIIAVLFVHEIGHFVSMKAFGYRDVRMFFIPMFGAAVSGRQTVPSGAKQAIVALMGPLPGIFVGTLFGILYISRPDTHTYLLLSRAFLFINAFNLLPFHPLDGAHLLQHCLFSRNAKSEVVFKFITGLCLVGVAILLRASFLGLFGVFVLISTSMTYVVASIASQLKKQVPPENRSPEHIPDYWLLTIVEALDQRIRGKNKTAKTLATLALDVWERICNRAPGIGATLGLLFAYAFIVVFSLVAILGVEIAAGMAEGQI